MNKIKSVSNLAFKGYGIELYPVTPPDLPILRRWRNSPQINIQMTDTSFITPHQQRYWYERIKERDDQAHWVVWCKGVRAGYVNIKGEGPLELQKDLSGGFYVGNSLVRHGLLGYAILMMQMDIVFLYLSASQYRGPILKSNYSARQLNKQLGYSEEYDNGSLVGVVLDPSDYKKAKKKFSRFFNDMKCQLIG